MVRNEKYRSLNGEPDRQTDNSKILKSRKKAKANFQTEKGAETETKERKKERKKERNK